MFCLKFVKYFFSYLKKIKKNFPRQRLLVPIKRNNFNLCDETISRTNEGQPRPKYIFNKCGTNIYFLTLQRFGPSPSPNFKSKRPEML